MIVSEVKQRLRNGENVDFSEMSSLFKAALILSMGNEIIDGINGGENVSNVHDGDEI